MKADNARTYMDNITLAALVYWLLRLRPKADAPQEIWYFDEVSSSARWALKVLAVLGYGKIQVVQVDYWAFMGSLSREGGRVAAYTQYVNALVFDIAFWHDFFKTQGIKANVDYSGFVSYKGIGGAMALRRSGGVSVSYQGSNLYDASLDMTPTSDVLFSYSPLFTDLWAPHRLPTESLIYTGYIFDGIFREVEVEAESRAERERLRAKGGRFYHRLFRRKFYAWQGCHYLQR